MILNREECLEWAFGQLLDNTTRGKVAEFIVATALDLVDGHRQEWDYADLFWQDKAIEVKSSAYLQSWKQERPSKIIFDIALRKQKWNATTNTVENLNPPRRLADFYVFCVFEELAREKANPLRTEQWSFFIVSTGELDKVLGPQKTLTRKRLEQFKHSVKFEKISDELEALMRSK